MTDPAHLSALAAKGFTEDDLRLAQFLGEVLDYAATLSLGVEAMASAIKGLRAGETVDEVVHRIRCDWDI